MQEGIKKLKFNATEVVVINPPQNLMPELEKLLYNFQFDKKIKSKNTLVFTINSIGLFTFLNKQLKFIEPDSVFWIAYPKGSSKIKTDINRDFIRETVLAYGIQTVAVVAIDDTWSALRFRPIEKVGK